MGQLAIALAKLGYKVSGSDKEFYEPMGSLLRESGLKLYEGYSANNLTEPVDLVVIGNAISYGNPEIAVIEEKNLAYSCFPTTLYDVVIAGRHSIVVTGTHGKSTTTAMTAHCLIAADTDPSYFVGGVTTSLPNSLNIGQGKFSVVEGDEYDDVFFSKRAKFFHYQANTCIINAIEFDHADLYADLTAIKQTFNELVLSLKAADRLLCCLDFPVIAEFLPEWQQKARCQIITFGESEQADVRIVDRKSSGMGQTFRVVSELLPGGEVKLNLPGDFNARNATAAYSACVLNGLAADKIIEALGKFTPVKRRQEVRFQNEQCVLIEDFAHHPTAVNATLKAVKEAHPDRELWAVFEPRSNTSRRAVFKQGYLEAFDQADRAVLCQVAARAIDSGQELLDVNKLAEEISSRGTPCCALPDASHIADFLAQNAINNSVIVIMSNGSFGGLPQTMTERLSKVS